MSNELRSDIETAWAKVSNKMGRKGDVKKVIEYLNDGETVLAMAGGALGGNLGLLVATDRRPLFVSEGIVHHSFEDFPYDRVTNVTSSRGMVFAKIIVQSGGAAQVIEQLSTGEAKAVAAIIRERVEASTRERCELSSASLQVGAPVSIAAELRDLALLREAGILTSEEFETQKTKLLGR